jgi:hypothetical protein
MEGKSGIPTRRKALLSAFQIFSVSDFSVWGMPLFLENFRVTFSRESGVDDVFVLHNSVCKTKTQVEFGEWFERERCRRNVALRRQSRVLRDNPKAQREANGFRYEAT